MSARDEDALVSLMNEAPGPSEATSGVPSFRQQGANIFHALRRAGISWAVAHQTFVWPKMGRHNNQSAIDKKLNSLQLVPATLRVRMPSLSGQSQASTPRNFARLLKMMLLLLTNIARIARSCTQLISILISAFTQSTDVSENSALLFNHFELVHGAYTQVVIRHRRSRLHSIRMWLSYRVLSHTLAELSLGKDDSLVEH